MYKIEAFIVIVQNTTKLGALLWINALKDTGKHHKDKSRQHRLQIVYQMNECM